MDIKKTAAMYSCFFVYKFCAKACIFPYTICYNDKGDNNENNV